MKRFLVNIAKRGTTVQFKYKTGTDCPCRFYNDPDHASYSPEWHRLNPLIENCRGSLLISSTTVTVDLKMIFSSMSQVNQTLYTFLKQSPAGEIEKDDLVALGAVNAKTDEYFDLTPYKADDGCYFVVNTNNYDMRSIIPFPIQDFNAELIVLRKQ